MATRRRAPSKVKYVEDSEWHISRNIPVALILTLILQGAGLIYWGSTVTKDIADLKEDVKEFKVQAAKRDDKLDEMGTLKSELKHISSILARLERTVDRAFPRAVVPRAQSTVVLPQRRN